MVTKKDLGKLGPAIKRLRKARGLTTKELALAVGVSYKHMANVQDGHTIPSLVKYVQICHVFGVKGVPMI